MATFKAVILTGEKHTKTDGSANIKIRATHNRKSFYIATDMYVLPANFNNGTIHKNY